MIYKNISRFFIIYTILTGVFVPYGYAGLLIRDNLYADTIDDYLRPRRFVIYKQRKEYFSPDFIGRFEHIHYTPSGYPLFAQIAKREFLLAEEQKPYMRKLLISICQGIGFPSKITPPYFRACLREFTFCIGQIAYERNASESDKSAHPRNSQFYMPSPLRLVDVIQDVDLQLGEIEEKVLRILMSRRPQEIKAERLIEVHS